MFRIFSSSSFSEPQTSLARYFCGKGVLNMGDIAINIFIFSKFFLAVDKIMNSTLITTKKKVQILLALPTSGHQNCSK